MQKSDSSVRTIESEKQRDMLADCVVVDQILDVVTRLWDWSWAFANSNLFSSFLAAIAGAFGGAYGAQWIVERTQRQRRLLEEIRNTNAAIMAAFSCTNTFLALKDQHVRSLRDTYDKQKLEFEDFQGRRHRGEIPLQQEYDLQVDFRTFKSIPVPIGVLQTLLFEKVSVTGRALPLVTTLSQCIAAMDSAVDARNQIIEKHRASSPNDPNALAVMYFGLRNRDGHIDRSYVDCIDTISSHTDDCIFFSWLLISDLVTHGKSLADEYGKKAPKIHEPDFAKAEANGLMPDKKLYADWVTTFR